MLKYSKITVWTVQQHFRTTKINNLQRTMHAPYTKLSAAAASYRLLISFWVECNQKFVKECVAKGTKMAYICIFCCFVSCKLVLIYFGKIHRIKLSQGSTFSTNLGSKRIMLLRELYYLQGTDLVLKPMKLTFSIFKVPVFS